MITWEEFKEMLRVFRKTRFYLKPFCLVAIALCLLASALIYVGALIGVLGATIGEKIGGWP